MERFIPLNSSRYGLMARRLAATAPASPCYPHQSNNWMQPLHQLVVVCVFVIGLCAVGLSQRAHGADFSILVGQEASTDAFVKNAPGLHDSFMASLKNELSNIGFNVKDARKRDTVSNQDQGTKDGVTSEKLDLILTSKFFKLDDDLYIPALELRTRHDQRIIASVKTTPVRNSGELIKLNMQLESAAISLSRMIFSQLQDINWGEIKFQNSPWETETQSLRLRLNGMNGCLKNYFIDTVEREFPGSLSVSVLNEVTVGTSQYDLKTNAKVRYVTKWLRALLRELGLSEGDNFDLSVQKRFVTLKLFPAAQPYGVGC